MNHHAPSSGMSLPDRSAPLGILKQRFGERFSDGMSVREQHGHTTSWTPNQPPEAVVWAESADEVRDVVRICAEHRVPIIPFGTGSSLEGHVNAPRGGVSLDMSRMNRVLRVSPEDLDCTVEPGVTRKALNAHLRDTGLFFPIDPGADASLGGMVATRASGTNAVRYGTMKDNVLALEAVLANGELLRTARRARKTSAGYDLTRLLVGSEGTLGIVTAITLKLAGIPEAVSGGVCPFPDVGSAVDATILTIQSGIPVARIELLDALQVKACNAHSKLSLPESPCLFLEFHGSPAGVAEQSAAFAEIAGECGGGPFDWATDPEVRGRLWSARHDAYWAAMGLRPGGEGVSTDVCVPISRLTECITETQDDIAELRLVAPIVGHVGDGNFHTLALMDPGDADEVGRVETLLARLAERAIRMDGTCTGEHGIGQGKAKYLTRELGDPAIAAMRAIKTALDPHDLMNPGKIVPDLGPVG